MTFRTSDLAAINQYRGTDSEKIAAIVFMEGEPMNWNLRTYQHEGDRSHTHELVVASAWTVMFGLLVAASVLDRPTKLIETAQTVMSY